MNRAIASIFMLLFGTSCIDTDGLVEGQINSSQNQVFSGGNYFVYTLSVYNGDLGGLAGANEACFYELNRRYWRGKENFLQLERTQVRAFLCDGASCQNLRPSTTYGVSFADEDRVGVSFTADSAGLGPNNSIFGESRINYWTGRDAGLSLTVWPNISSSDNCSSWTDSTSGSGRIGYANRNDEERWSLASTNCSSLMGLICIVD